MDNKIIETLENLEDKIENIKWLITPWHLKRTGISEAISLIRRTAGILGSNFPQGTAFENKARKEWNADIAKRIR